MSALQSRTRAIICWMHYVEGKSQDQIARETHHSLWAVDNYLGKFDRVRHCLAQGLNPTEIAFTLNCSLRLVDQYILIDERIQQHHHECKGKDNIFVTNIPRPTNNDSFASQTGTDLVSSDSKVRTDGRTLNCYLHTIFFL